MVTHIAGNALSASPNMHSWEKPKPIPAALERCCASLVGLSSLAPYSSDTWRGRKQAHRQLQGGPRLDQLGAVQLGHLQQNYLRQPIRRRVLEPSTSLLAACCRLQCQLALQAQGPAAQATPAPEHTHLPLHAKGGNGADVEERFAGRLVGLGKRLVLLRGRSV